MTAQPALPWTLLLYNPNVFEHHRQKLIPRRHFYRRVASSFSVAVIIIACSLTIGVLGYHSIAGLPWVDAFMNAAMILSGMGPVHELHGSAAKIFAGCYALFSGIVFLSTAAVIFAPLVHRLLHRFHALEEEIAPGSSSKKKE